MGGAGAGLACERRDGAGVCAAPGVRGIDAARVVEPTDARATRDQRTIMLVVPASASSALPMPRL